MKRTLVASIVLHCVAFVCLDLWLAKRGGGQTIEVETVAWTEPAKASGLQTAVSRAKRRSRPQTHPRAAAANPSDVATKTATAPAPPATTAPSEIGESDVASLGGGRPAGSETEKYLAYVRDAIAVQQSYPAPSRALGEEGAVRLRLTLSKSGSLVKVELIEASAFKRLNDAAMRAAAKASPFRPFPLEMAAENWRITLPVRFSLAQR